MDKHKLEEIRKLAGRLDEPALKQRLDSRSEAVQVWAVIQLLQTESPSTEIINSALKFAPYHPEVYWRVCDHLATLQKYGLIQQLSNARSFPESYESLTDKLGKILSTERYEDVPATCEYLFRLTGKRDYLHKAMDSVLDYGSPNEWFHYFHIFALVTKSVEEFGNRLIQLLLHNIRAGYFDTYQKLKASLPKLITLASPYERYFHGIDCFIARDYQKAVEHLNSVIEWNDTGYLSRAANRDIAVCHERLGNYKAAAQAYEEVNRIACQHYTGRMSYASLIDEKESKVGKPLPEDDRRCPIILTSFSRSGTTLLDNVLDSHPMINTIEERSAFGKSYVLAFKTPTAADENCTDHFSRAMAQRKLYWDILLNGETKEKNAVVIDKQPVASSDIVLLNYVFPNAKYLFPIRHPYDVVLSNYKQDFTLNIAMAEMSTLRRAAELYDKVMSRWFETMKTERERVCYLTYEDLVLQFERTISRVLNFLEIPWSEDVVNFAQNAEQRADRTPSYTKVRKGLSLGVQSSYQNYLFLFDDYCRSKLDPWVEFFGYTVEEPKK